MRGKALLVGALMALHAACGSSDPGDGGQSQSGGASNAGSAGSGASAGAAGAGGGAGGAGGSGATGTGASGGGAGASGEDGGAGSAGSDGGGDAGSAGADASDKLTAAECFAKQFVNNPTLGPDYDQFDPTIGTHCKGTNHQSIQGIQKVVFLGDSVTVGTPPTLPGNVYRAILAHKLASLLKIKAPGFGWGGYDPLSGVALPKESGDFISCAKWGARTDDLMQDSTQVVSCIPPANRHLRHLVVMTIGGNDISAITQDGGGAKPKKTIAELWADTQSFVQLLRETVTWLKDPANVPGGVEIVFGNLYEFTDGTGDTTSCTTAALGGIEPWQDKQAQTDMVVWAEEQYMKIAVDTQSDMIFMLESFCGHGYKRNDPTGPCYRGPNQPLWFDLTCIHPNDAGHAALADLFYSTIAE
jgi:lysophospholipase L1-like esterase